VEDSGRPEGGRGTSLLDRRSLMRDASLLQETLGQLIRVLQSRDRDRACCYDLSVSQCHALQTLIREGPLTVTHLGDHLHLEKSTASRLANGLLEEGLVRKRSPGSDGRVVILQVTEQGLRLSRKIMNDLTEEYMDLLADFEPEVRRALPRLLERLTDSVAGRSQVTGPSCCSER
jgi:DNA-binding MarR family transcriptional regulator